MVDVTKTLREALGRLEREKSRMERQIEALRTALGDGGRGGNRPARRRRGRKPMTAAARAAVSQRMKAYWAKRRGKGKGK